MGLEKEGTSLELTRAMCKFFAQYLVDVRPSRVGEMSKTWKQDSSVAFRVCMVKMKEDRSPWEVRACYRNRKIFSYDM